MDWADAFGRGIEYAQYDKDEYLVFIPVIHLYSFAALPAGILLPCAEAVQSRRL
jgi:hypothetical protein